MNTAQILACMCLARPDDADLAAVYTDAVMELRGCERAQAVAEVEATQRAGLDARELAAATHLLRLGGPYREEIQAALAEWCGLAEPYYYLSIVVPGVAEPEYTVSHRRRTSHWESQPVITVGAAWVVALHRELIAEDGLRPDCSS